MRQFMSKFFLPLFLFVIAISVILTGFSGSTLIGDGSEGLVVKSIELSPEDSGLTFIDQDRKGITVRMDIGTLDFVPVSTESGSFILPRIKGFSRNFNEGEPTLPVASKLIKIPFGCELDVTVLDSESETFQLSAHELTAPFMPVQPPLSKSQDPSTVAFEYNQDVYKKEKYSLPLASTEVLGTMRSTRLGRIAISPVEYYPTKNQITVYKSVTVRIIFKNPNWAWTNDMQEKYASCYFEPVNKQVLNFEPENSLNSDLVNYPVKYLIISDRMFESQLAPFIQWKTEKGFDVVVSYTDVIGTTTTAIQNYIEGLYNAGTVEDPAPSFVLLVGDVQQIPSFDGSSGSHITDLRYCEFTGDDYPEIYYGRFSAQTTAQLQPQIDKTLEYEQYTMPDPSYLADVTLVSGVDSTYAATHGNGQINYGTNYYFNAAHGINTNVWLYPDSNASGASAAIISTISNGVGFFNYTAHCSHTGPADPSFDQGDIASLTNAHKYLLGIGNCCLSNTFGSDYSTPSFGEAWMQAEDKGGIGWIGTSNNSYWDEDYWWGVGSGSIVAAGPDYDDVGIGAYDGIFHDHGEAEDLHYVTNGAIMYCGNMAVTEAGASRIQYYWEIYHLMGDPSIMAYMGLPSTNSVNHSSTVSPSATTFTVQAEAGSYVGLSLNGTLHGAGYIGSTGSASIPLTAFGTSGTADIVVTCQNKIPYVSTLNISSGTVPPTAGFTGAPLSGSTPLTVNFTDQSLDATTWAWDFGDTDSSTEQSPSHTYTSIGTYTVSLTVTNSYGNDTETKTSYITVVAPQPPVADFTASATAIYEGQSIDFTDISTNSPTSWAWTFAGGTPASSTEQNQSVSFAAAGTYTIALTASNAAGNDTETKTDYITVTVEPIEYCVSQGNNSTYEWIGNVTVGSLNNTSGAADYTDFTSITTNYSAGSDYAVSLTPEFSDATYQEFWKIWIDFNVDGDFDDAGEEVFSQGLSSTTVTGTLTIPSGVECLTRMRVSMKYNDEQTSTCESFSFGEVEDYTVNITDGGIVDPPVAEFTANTTTIEIGQSVNFSDLSTNSPTSWLWTFAGGTPSSSSDQTPSITYNTAGTYEVTLTATNAGGSDDETKSGYITVNPGSGSSLVLETGNLSGVANSWQTVTLSNTYTSMVVVCTNDLGTTGIPAVCRIRNASGNSFDVMVQNPSGNALSDCNVHYVVVEEGVYTVAAHGIKMEAVKADATATAYATSSWVVEARTYSNSYSNPVVVGQVMSYNDTNWSVFWASGSNYKDPPSASELYAGKQVSEDTNKERKSRNTETIGYIVIEEGTGSINGIPYTAALGADTVRGPDNNASGYTYNFSSVSNASTAILSCAGMDGNNGGWPVLFDATSLTSTSMGLIFDEDQVKDSERKHTTEQVAFIVFGE